MFHHITGTLTSATPETAVVDCGGVGYLLKIPHSSYDVLPALGQRVTLLAYLNVKDDALTLYGFLTEAERRFFQQLIQNVDGVGPKLALAVLSRGPLQHLQQAIRMGNFAALKGGGVGEAIAKRIVLELGKVLVRDTQLGEVPEAEARTARRVGATLVTNTGSLVGLDELTGTAVKAVAQLNEVPSDIALRAVQRAYDELRDRGAKVIEVQDLIRRALPYAE